jgi:Flp pilus assembly protein TadB
MIIFAALFISLFVGGIIYLVFPQRPSLAKRLHPYATVVRVRLNGTYDTTTKVVSENYFQEFLRPVYEALTRVVVKISSFESEDSLSLRLEQAGMDPSVTAYRALLTKRVLINAAVGLCAGVAIKKPVGVIFFPVVLSVIAFSRTQASIDAKIEQRRSTMRAELYTIDQLLALHIRTGSGVVQALQSIVRRTRGIIPGECEAVLNRARTGQSIEDSLYIAAQKSPEPHAVRMYKLLAAASHRGVDLTGALLDLAYDLRRSLREDVKATSAKRRAAMLIPTIGILAPIMLLFIAAPIPSIVLGGR